MEPDITMDLCGLPPPEPMERVLDALSTMPKEQRLCMLIDREPRPLYRILTNNGYSYRTTIRADGRYEVLIWNRD